MGSVLPVITSVAALVLGLLYLAQGAGKAKDMPGYEEGLHAFEFFPARTIPVVARLWMVLEIFGGLLVALAALSHFFPVDDEMFALPGEVGLWIILAMSIAYTVVNGTTWARRLPVSNCTCFGTFFPQRLGLFVMVQDVLGIAWAAGLLWFEHSFTVT